MTRNEFESLPAGTIVRNVETGTEYRVARLVKVSESAHARYAAVPPGSTAGSVDYSARTLRANGTERGPYRIIPFAKVEISR